MTVQDEHDASRRPPRLRLRGLADGEGGGRWEIGQALTVFGSGSGCDLRLRPQEADSAHAAVVLLGNTAYLCDFGAAGGTSLNGRRIRWARLADGDEMAVNTCHFRVELDEDRVVLTGEQPSFKLRDDSSIGEVMTIDPVLIVGSDPGCDVVLHDDAVAPRHCLVVWTQEGPLLRGLQEGDHPRLNGMPTRFARLVSGDRIAIGPYEMTFQIETASPEFAEAVRPDYSDRVRLSSGKTVLLPGKEPLAVELVSGCVGASETPEDDLLWSDSTVASSEEVEATAAGSSDLDEGEASEHLHSEAELEPMKNAEDHQPAEAAAPVVESAEAGNAAGDIGEIGEREEPTVDSDFAAEDERMEPTEPAREPSATEQRDRMEAETGNERGGADEDRLARVRSRVAAAQKALDQRALNHLERLNSERQRLRAYQVELQQKASELLRVARENRQLLNRGRVAAESGFNAAKASEELTVLGRLAGELETIEATHASDTQSLDDGNNGILGDALSGTRRRSLQARAAELAELVREEQDEIDRAESQFVSLRLGIRRMRDFIDRTGIRHRARAAELETLLGTLRREEASLAKERGLLMAKLQELDGQIARVAARARDAGQDREDLDREVERLALVQKKLVEKEETLRTGLDVERQRVQVRQAELQHKATEVARAARDKRCAIEAEMTKRRAALDLREAELRTHRAAIEEAGRNELEKAATELERVLSVRLADIEVELSKKQSGAAPGKPPAAAGPKATNEPADASTAHRSGVSAADDLPSEGAVLAHMLRDTVYDRDRRLAALREELEALRDAMTNMGKQEKAGEASIEDEMRTLRASLTGARRDRRWSSADWRGQFDKDNATLRSAEKKSDDQTALGAEVAAASSAPGGPQEGEGR
ncbi:MAG TPA: FHA domain-containing protein [Phycisphaerae bacterium]|nr:FHA domain-containing protein [Phycisphaerae bacterium]